MSDLISYSSRRARYFCPVNCLPLSVTIANGMPKQEIPPNKADDISFFDGDHRLGINPLGKVVGSC